MPLHSELNHRMNMSDAAITAAAVPHALQKMKIARRMQTARKKCRLKKNDRLQKKKLQNENNNTDYKKKCRRRKKYRLRNGYNSCPERAQSSIKGYP